MCFLGFINESWGRKIRLSLGLLILRIRLFYKDSNFNSKIKGSLSDDTNEKANRNLLTSSKLQYEREKEKIIKNHKIRIGTHLICQNTFDNILKEKLIKQGKKTMNFFIDE